MEGRRTKAKVAFMDLPTELRRQIWDLAIWNRECLPEAHFFNAAKEGLDCEQDVTEDPFTNDWLPALCNLRSPSWNPSKPGQFKWNLEENVSGYTRNSGLWNACTESRQALIHRWKNRQKKYRHYGVLDSVKSFKVPGDNDQDFFIVTYTCEDLICINIAHLDGLDYSGDLGYGSYQNFGFEFETSFFQEFEKRCITGEWYNKSDAFRKMCATYREKTTPTTPLDHFFDHLERFKECPVNIWLIDHRLQPRSNFNSGPAIEGSQRRAVFRAQNRRFVEVMDTDIMPKDASPLTDEANYLWTTSADSWVETWDSRVIPDVFTFAEYVHDYTEELDGSVADWDETFRWSGSRVRVLGCVTDEE